MTFLIQNCGDSGRDAHPATPPFRLGRQARIAYTSWNRIVPLRFSGLPHRIGPSPSSIIIIKLVLALVRTPRLYPLSTKFENTKCRPCQDPASRGGQRRRGFSTFSHRWKSQGFGRLTLPSPLNGADSQRVQSDASGFAH